MPQQVLIHNTSSEDYAENFEGEVIKIPAGESIEMDNSTGRKFIGTIPPARKDEFGNSITPNKCLQLERIGFLEEDANEKFVSNKDGREYSTEGALLKHLETLQGQQLKDLDAEKRKPVKIFMCHICGKETTAKIALQNHLKAHDDKKDITNDTTENKGPSKESS